MEINISGLNSSSIKRENYEEEFHPSFQPQIDVMTVIIALTIICFNSSVLFLMKTRRSLRTVTNSFLASLAACDLLTGLYTIPTYLACKATWSNAICLANLPILTFTSMSTLCHICIVTVDRYIAIMYSLRYSCVVTKPRARVTIVLAWVFSATVACVQLTWAVPGTVDVTEDGDEEFRRHEVSFSVSLMVIVLVPLPMLVLAYIKIFLEVRRQNGIAKKYNRSCDRRRVRTRELRTVLVLSLMLSAYLFCWMPNALIRYQYSTQAFELPLWAEYVIIELRFFTSLLNPCFYVFGKKDFRKSINCLERSSDVFHTLGKIAHKNYRGCFVVNVKRTVV